MHKPVIGSISQRNFPLRRPSRLRQPPAPWRNIPGGEHGLYGSVRGGRAPGLSRRSRSTQIEGLVRPGRRHIAGSGLARSIFSNC